MDAGLLGVCRRIALRRIAAVALAVAAAMRILTVVAAIGAAQKLLE